MTEPARHTATDRWHCQAAWVEGSFAADVLVESTEGVITSIDTGVAPPPDATRLDGTVFGGFANTHSHVFHRLLRGQSGPDQGDFWSWREAMYAVADSLDPDSYRAVAAAAFREMVLAGYSSVAEFHYLHHQPGGQPYANPNVMAEALADAADETGVRLTLLDTCYLSAGFGEPPAGPQRRFADPSVHDWAERVAGWKPPPHVVLGAAIHSVRAVDPAACAVVADWATGRPLHVHVSEQPAENEAALAHYGATPTRVLAEAGALGPGTTAVHCTHVSADDIALLAETDTTVSVCPTTERWLADGIGPTGRLAAAGVALTVGSDSQTTIDPFEEMRLLELHQRLLTGRTGTHLVEDVLAAGTGRPGSLGVPGPLGLTPGAPADLVVVSATSPRTAGTAGPALVFSAGAADVTEVVLAGKSITAP